MRFIFFTFLIISTVFLHAQQPNKGKSCESVPELIPFKSNNNKYGYLNKKGEVVIKPQYDEARPFMFDFEIFNSENAKQFGKKEYATVKIDQKHFRINDLGNIVLDLDEVVYNISDCCPSIPHKLKIVRFRNRFGVKDVNDEWVVKPKYDQIEYLFYLDEYEDHFLVTRKNKMGVVDKSGHVIIPIKYKSLRNMTTSVNPSDGILFKGVLQDKEVIIDLCNNQYNLL